MADCTGVYVVARNKIPRVCEHNSAAMFSVPGITLRMVTTSVLMTCGRTWIRAGIEVAGLTVLIVTAVLLAIRFGADGMLLALASSQ